MSAENTSLSPSENPIQLQILGEYYFRKGNLTAAKDMFSNLHTQDPSQYIFCYHLGKIYYRLGNVPKAIDYLTKAKNINPLHRQTLLLLHHCYSRTKDYQMAFESILDLYIMAKEVKDQHIYYYEKRIKSTSRKIADFSPEKKSTLLKRRVESLQNFFLNLEKNRQNIPLSATHAHTEELSPEMGRSINDYDEEDLSSEISSEKNEDISQTYRPIHPVSKPAFQTQMDEEKTFVDDDATTKLPNPPAQSQNQEAFKTQDEDSLEFDLYPKAGDTGPTLVQPFEEEQTFVDDHALEAKPPSAETDPSIETGITTASPSAAATHLKDALLQVAFLRQLSEPKLNKIQHFTSILEFKDGDMIFQENEPVFGFHILLKGDVEIIKARQPLHYHSAPKIIDEDDFFRVNSRSFSMRAKSKVEMLFFNKAGYQNLYQRDPRIAVQFLWHFSQSLAQKIDGCIEEILLQTPAERFMEELDQKHEVSILRKLNSSELKVLSSLFDPIHLKKKEKIYSKQENRKHFYVLMDGNVECSNPNRDPIRIQKGEYFGEMVFCGPGANHLYDATVVSDHAKLLQISHKQLSALNQFEEDEQKFLADMLVRILSNKNKELRELLYQTRYIMNKG